MPQNINLLPQSRTLNTQVALTATRLTRLTIVVFISFLIFGGLSIGFLFLGTNDLQKVQEQNDNLKLNIKSLQEAEQNLILVRDRVGKIKTIISERSFEDKLAKIQNLMKRLPVGQEPKTLEIDITRSRGSLNFETSESLANFLRVLIENDDYGQIELNTLQFDINGEYEVELVLV